MSEWRPEPGYDPVETADTVARIVCRGNERKYYRFRRTRFYGGCATADAVGCNLDCFYCYVNYPRRHPWDPRWRYLSPSEVAERLTRLAKELRTARLSGCEPTLCPDHLIETLETFERSARDVTFILETNGTLLGADRVPVGELERFESLHVRLCLKGCDPESFHEITGADPEGFRLQLKAVKELASSSVRFHVALPDLFTIEEMTRLFDELSGLGVDPGSVELEPVTVYDHVLEEARRRGVEWRLPNSASCGGTSRSGTR